MFNKRIAITSDIDTLAVLNPLARDLAIADDPVSSLYRQSQEFFTKAEKQSETITARVAAIAQASGPDAQVQEVLHQLTQDTVAQTAVTIGSAEDVRQQKQAFAQMLDVYGHWSEEEVQQHADVVHDFIMPTLARQIYALAQCDTPEAVLEIKMFVRQAIDASLQHGDDLLADIVHIYQGLGRYDELQELISTASYCFLDAEIPSQVDKMLLALHGQTIYLHCEDEIGVNNSVHTIDNVVSELGLQQIFARIISIIQNEYLGVVEGQDIPDAIRDVPTFIAAYLQVFNDLGEAASAPIDFESLIQNPDYRKRYDRDNVYMNYETFSEILRYAAHDLVLEEKQIDGRHCLVKVDVTSDEYKQLVLKQRARSMQQAQKPIDTMSRWNIFQDRQQKFYREYAQNVFGHWLVDTEKVKAGLHKDFNLLKGLSLDNMIFYGVNFESLNLTKTSFVGSTLINCHFTNRNRDLERYLKGVWPEARQREIDDCAALLSKNLSFITEERFFSDLNYYRRTLCARYLYKSPDWG